MDALLIFLLLLAVGPLMRRQKMSPTRAGVESIVRTGEVHHFCSQQCREIFETAPELHAHGVGGQNLEPSHA